MKRFLIFVALLLTACGDSGEGKYAFNEEKFKKGNMAYVFLTATNNAHQADFRVGDYFTFKSDEGRTIKLSNMGEEGRGFMIPPGRYQLTEFRLYGARQRGNSTMIVNIPLYTVVASFEVMPGDVVYLGSVETRIARADRSSIGRTFNRPVPDTNIGYTSVVRNRLGAGERAAIEEKTGRELTVRLMSWRKQG